MSKKTLSGIIYLIALTVLVCPVFADEVTYKYDSLGRIIKIIYKDGPQFYYYYDKAGNRIEKQVTAPKNCGDVVTTNYTFTSDWTSGGGHGLVMGGGDITIDGSGYTLDGGGTGQGLVIGESGMTGSQADTTEKNYLIGDVSPPESQPATTPEDAKDTPEVTMPVETAVAPPASLLEPTTHAILDKPVISMEPPQIEIDGVGIIPHKGVNFHKKKRGKLQRSGFILKVNKLVRKKSASGMTPMRIGTIDGENRSDGITVEGHDSIVEKGDFPEPEDGSANVSAKNKVHGHDRGVAKEKIVEMGDCVPGIEAAKRETDKIQVKASRVAISPLEEHEHHAVIASMDIKKDLPVASGSDGTIITFEQCDNMFAFHIGGNESKDGKTIIKIPVLGLDLEKIDISNRRAEHIKAVGRVSRRLQVKKIYPGSLAEKAGVLPLDVILGFNNMELKNINHIIEFLQAYKDEKKVELKILRANKIKKVDLKMVTACGKSDRRQHELP